MRIGSPPAVLGPKTLFDLVGVARDHGVRRVENHLGRTIVLLQLDHSRVGIVLLEIEDV